MDSTTNDDVCQQSDADASTKTPNTSTESETDQNCISSSDSSSNKGTTKTDKDTVNSSTDNNSTNKDGEGAVSTTDSPWAPPRYMRGHDSVSDSKSILAPTKFGDSGSTSNSTTSVLRPSFLSSTGGGGGGGMKLAPARGMFVPPTLTVTAPPSSRPAFQLKPSVLGSGSTFGSISQSTNPFARAIEDPSESPTGKDTKSALKNGSTSASDACDSSDHKDRTRTLFTPDVSSSTGTGTDGESSTEASDRGADAVSTTQSPKTNNSTRFMPLNTDNRLSDVSSNSNSLTPTMNGLSSRPTSQFIFGQNLHTRVSGDTVSTFGSNNQTSPTSNNAAPSTNGDASTPNLFSAAAAAAAPTTGGFGASNANDKTGNLFSDAASGLNKGTEDGAWGGGKSLSETSRELTEKENSQKRKFEEVEVITGEESESNVLQMNCKLYGWVSKSWQERGRGILRLNDWGTRAEMHSRLVIRTQGTLTVMLNTQVWPGMSVEKAGQKSVRFTASDADGQPKIFLVMGSPKDVKLLYNSLEWRVATCRSQCQEPGDESDSAKKAKRDQMSPSSAEPPPYDENELLN